MKSTVPAQIDSNKAVNGGRCPKVVEHPELTISRWYEIWWKKQELDSAELAKLRWIKKWSIERLAKHFAVGTTSIKVNLRKIRRAKGRSHVLPARSFRGK